jgi:Ca2+-binding RTX toxin-like protein
VIITSDVSDQAGDNDPLTLAWSVTKDGTSIPFILGSGEVTFTPSSIGIYEVRLDVTDDDGGSGTAFHTVTINDVAPTVIITAPQTGVRGQPLEFTFITNDPNPADTAGPFTYYIDWNGDLVVDQTVTGGSSVQLTHIFDTTDVYLVRATAQDQSQLEGQVATHLIAIWPVLLVPDPVGGTNVAILAGGTSGNDLVQFTRGSATDSYVVKIVSQVAAGAEIIVGVFRPTVSGCVLELSIGTGTVNFSLPLTGLLNRFIVYGQAGNDDLQVAGNISFTTELHGDDGNDRVGGGGGSDLLLGGAGDDLLVGRQGRDVMIGGHGRDRMVGNADDDILVGGYTVHDSNDEALRLILAEWTSGRSYVQRVANLQGTGSGPSFAARYNGNVFLQTDGPNATVLDDLAQDFLIGSSGIDWLLFNPDLGSSNPSRDKITDLNDIEFANDADFLAGI